MFNFFKKKTPPTLGNPGQNSKLIDTVISPNVNLFAVINNDNVMYLNENMIGFGKKDNDGDENFNGRVVNFIFLNKNNKIEALIALNEEYQYIFYDQNILLMTLNEIVKGVYLYLLKNFNIIEPTLNYESKYIYTFTLLKKEKEFLLGNTMGNIGYLINRTRILRGIPAELYENIQANNKRKKSLLEIQIEKDGIEHAARRISEIVLSKIPTNEIAYQFVLEELDAASQGEGIALDFVNRSGIDPSIYKGAMKNSMIEVDGPNGPQQTLSAFCFHLHENRVLMAELRIMVVENIMRHFSLGKYNESESAITQYNLGVSYLTGQGGVNQDMAEAAKWFKLAAEQGNVSAYFNLGLMYKNGQGVSRDMAEAVKWFKLAAEKGHARALVQIEFIDQNIEEIENNKTQSKDFVQSLSRQGDVNAQFNNGIASYNIQSKK